MVGLQAAELPSVDETAITDTATSPPRPKNSAFNSGYFRSIGRLSESALSHYDLFSAVFIINIAESGFRHTQPTRRRSTRGHGAFRALAHPTVRNTL
jgi:hypothetical protein